MTTMREFIAKLDDYNARVHQESQALPRLQALETEREILREQASEFMRLSQFDAEVAKFSLPRFTFPENYQPPERDYVAASSPGRLNAADAPIIRHDDKAAE